MKKSLSFLIALIACSEMLYGQEKFKFGTCPIELLQQTSYELDADVEAFYDTFYLTKTEKTFIVVLKHKKSCTFTANFKFLKRFFQA